MNGYAKTIILGRITKDVESKYTPGGCAVAEFSVAFDEYRKQGNVTHFLDVVALGNQAENIVKFFGKGDAIFLECIPQLDRWEDRDGKARSKIRFKVERWDFTGGRREQGESREYYQSQAGPALEDVSQDDGTEPPF